MATHSSILGFPGDSDGKESACNVGDLSSIPGLGRSPREGNGNLPGSSPGGSRVTRRRDGVGLDQETTVRLNIN